MASGNGNRLIDRRARRRATTDFSTNLVVQAGAGTGKTSLLVERALNAIGSGVTEVEGLAAITFTEKAAGEMRERLALGLDRLRSLACGQVSHDPTEAADRALDFLTGEGKIPVETIAERALAAMEELDSSTVVTIHGFCSELLRRYPIEAGVDPDFIVDTGEQTRSLLRTEWETFLTEELGPEGRREALWKSAIEKSSVRTLGEAALMLSGLGIPEDLLEADRAPSARELFAASASRRVRDIDGILARDNGMTPKTLEYFGYVRAAFTALSEQGLDGFRAALNLQPDLAAKISGKVKWSKPTPNAKLRNVTKKEFKDLVSETSGLARDLYRIDDTRAAEIVEVLGGFIRGFRERCLRRGFVSFDGLLALTRDLLRDHPDVRNALKQSCRLLLVDEFQDTDPLQYEIVLYLAEESGGKADDPYAAELEPGRLFVVGDPKQSIYRFRGADYSAYRHAIDRIVDAGGVQLELLANFRSVPGVLDPVNRLFAAGGCWDASAYQPEYAAIQPAREQDDTAPRVEVWTVELPEGALAEDRREAEGRVLAEAIHQRVETDRDCDYRDITILFRAFTNVSHYLRPLRERGVPFVVDGGRDFLERPEVAQILATLRTVSQPSDPAALLAFLRSPAGAVSDVELAEYARERKSWNWRVSVDASRFPRIDGSFRCLQRIARETIGLPADAVVRRVIEGTLLEPLGAAAFEGPQRVANLRKLAAAAGELARDGRLSLEEVIEALAEGQMEEIKTDRPLADDAADAVRITSIHRMKGLENSWVFLPDLARQKHTQRSIPLEIDAVVAPGGRTALSLKVEGITNAAHVRHKTENRAHAEAEEVRVLYVALTRAREHLVVMAGPTRRYAPWVDALAPWGYDGTETPANNALLCDGQVLHRRLEPTRRREPAPIEHSENVRRSVERYTTAVRRLNETATPPLSTPSGVEEGRPFSRESREAKAPADRDLGKATGRVLHQLLEHWNLKDPGTLPRHLARLSESVAREAGLDVDELRGRAAPILEGFLGSDLVERLQQVEVVGREVPILFSDRDGKIFNGSIDLLYRDADGRIFVADYKTDREDNAKKLAERYRAQLEIYAEAVQASMGGLFPPNRELWLLTTGERVPV